MILPDDNKGDLGVTHFEPFEDKLNIVDKTKHLERIMRGRTSELTNLSLVCEAKLGFRHLDGQHATRSQDLTTSASNRR